jgi:hypothetical protein
VSKFNNKKTEVHGIIFDSKMESDYYLYLLEQQEQGLITNIQLQPVYLLQPNFKKLGRTIRKIEYKADFLVTYTDGTQVLIDVKGVATPDFKIKAKMFDYYFPLELQIVTKHKGEWMLLKDKPKKKQPTEKVGMVRRAKQRGLRHGRKR